ncbi:MAG TPA: type II toxin-antitoxin system HicA family toxin [Chloroflexi bacterium]|nr:type II toxin-antitoxin system HicA family toxin [Chloroflexota bacterium]
MRYRELAKRLRRLGCEIERQGRGSHTVWRNPITGQRSVVANWGSKDIPPGTVRGILRQLSLSRKDFGTIK